MTLKDIPKFEKMSNLSINVYGIEYEEDGESEDEYCKNEEICVVVPLHLSKEDSDERTIHLLMVEVPSEDIGMDIDDIESRITNFEPKFHFALINDLSRLVSRHVSQHNTRKFFCDQCLCHFQEKSVYQKHRQDCIQNNKV